MNQHEGFTNGSSPPAEAIRERDLDLDLDKTGNVRGQADPEAAALDEEDGVLGTDGDPGLRDLAGEGDVLGGAPEPGHSPAAGLGRESLWLTDRVLQRVKAEHRPIVPRYRERAYTCQVKKQNSNTESEADNLLGPF
jgi:hypothetical protein